MLFARTSVNAGTTGLKVHIGADPELLLAAVHRVNAIHDTRIAPPSPRQHAGGSVVYLILDGRIRWHATMDVVHGPAIAIFGRNDSGDARPSREPTFRAEGASFRAIEVRVPGASAFTMAPRRTAEA